MILTQLFCDTDDFFQEFIPEWKKTQLEEGLKKRCRKRSLSQAEIITIIVYYHPFDDKGYVSKKLTELLAENDVELITTLKKNMKPKILATFDKLLLRKRIIIETINDQLKNIFDLEHSRHRSLTNYIINIIASLVAYSYQPKKPSLKIRREDLLPFFD